MNTDYLKEFINSNKPWTVDYIRQVMAKVDEMTGLNGSKLPISKGNARGTLGSYSCAKSRFRFSRHYFDDPTWPREAAIDTILHEYAHYMAYTLHKDHKHGRIWKEYCKLIGARPVRLYSDIDTSILRAQASLAQKRRNELSVLVEGKTVLHPGYGEGVITGIEDAGVQKRVTVDFGKNGVKILGGEWVYAHCNVE